MFVLAHLSDPHIGPLPRPRFFELLSKRIVGYANWWRRRARVHRLAVLDALTRDLIAQPHDHTAVTGDLVNIALAGEFALAQAWLDKLGSPEDVSFVPGNHDAYVRGAMAHWDAHWDAFMRGDAEAIHEPATVRFPYVRRRGPVALVGLSTAVPTLPISASGRLGREQVARLIELLGRLADERLFRIVLIHHPPITPPAKRLKRLIDGTAFRDAIAQVGAELVLHGHTHKQSLIWLKGPQAPVPVIGVPSASAVPGWRDDAAAYNLYRIAGEAGDWSCEVVTRGFRTGEDRIGEIARHTLPTRIPF
jgi:3',5'-cyclic AMP phosphodiesterase CpdA